MKYIDRYFYSIEMNGDDKVVHLSGNVYLNNNDHTDTCYRYAEWTFLYIDLPTLRDLIKDDETFFDYIDERVAYLGDINESEAFDICNEYFDGKPGTHLNIEDVDENTPIGDYWFE